MNTLVCLLCTVYLTFVGLNFHELPVFVVCDVIAQALPIWSKFFRYETFADDYWSAKARKFEES